MRRAVLAGAGVSAVVAIAAGAWVLAPRSSTLRANESTSSAPSAPSPAAASDAGVTVAVSGDHLVDGAGHVVVLRGVNVSGTEFACDQGGTATSRGWSIYGGAPLASASTYAAMRAWHINAVRVPLNEDCWLGINGVKPTLGGAAYVAAIQDEVAAIHAAGMVVVLDLHWSAPGAYAAIAQQPLPDADHSIAFWSSVASTFRAQPGMVFDLFNEPYLYASYEARADVSPWTCWRDGCTLIQFVSARQVGPDGAKTGYTTPVAWSSAGMQTLVNAVRSAGAKQPVVVDGLDWSNDLSGWLENAPQDPTGQLVAGWHSYPSERCDSAACWTGTVAAVAHAVPLLIGEVGDAVCGPAGYVDRLLTWADAQGMSYLGWTWNPWTNCQDVLITSWDGTPTANYGVSFRSHLAALP